MKKVLVLTSLLFSSSAYAQDRFTLEINGSDVYVSPDDVYNQIYDGLAKDLPNHLVTICLDDLCYDYDAIGTYRIDDDEKDSGTGKEVDIPPAKTEKKESEYKDLDKQVATIIEAVVGKVEVGGSVTIEHVNESQKTTEPNGTVTENTTSKTNVKVEISGSKGGGKSKGTGSSGGFHNRAQ